MSKEVKEYPQDHHAPDDQFMKISDYSQERNSDVDEYPFQELENILSPEESGNKKEQFYKDKIVELQQKCSKLFKTASYLTRRIESLQIELTEREEIQLEPSSVGEFLELLSLQVENYKKELGSFIEKQAANSRIQSKQVQNLRNMVEQLKAQNSDLQNEAAQLQDRNKELFQSKSDLLNEIENLQNQLEDLKTTKKSSKTNKNYSRTTFDDEIQAELEVLIEKLMAELETERNNNKKAVYEMKRMQEEIVKLQRQLVMKNNKIYSLEMKELRSNRGDNKKEPKSDRVSFETSFKTKNRNERPPPTKNITLEELLAESSDVNEKERYIVASKILNFYLRKFESEDFDPLHQNQIMLCNYNKNSPQLIAIKKTPNTQPYSEQTSPKIMGWNLSVLLSKLLIQPSYGSEYFDENVKILTQAIDEFIEEQDPSASSFSSLKSLIDEIIKTLK